MGLNILKQILENEEKKNKMSTLTNYIDWLVSFFKKYPYFDDYPDTLDMLNDITDEDLENIKDIHLFFDIIANYFANYDDYNLNKNFYLIKYTDNCFKIGFISGQGGMFYIEKIPSDEGTIDFNNIMNYYIINKPLTKKRLKK